MENGLKGMVGKKMQELGMNDRMGIEELHEQRQAVRGVLLVPVIISLVLHRLHTVQPLVALHPCA